MHNMFAFFHDVGEDWTDLSINQRIFLVAVVVLSVLLGGMTFVNHLEASVTTTTQVNWIFDIDEGLLKSQNDQKFLLLNFYADWCGWCLRLDQDTYGNTTVALFLNENLICVNIDVETNGALTHTYQVSTIPLVVLLSDTGDELRRIVGYRSPSAFLEELSHIAS